MPNPDAGGRYYLIADEHVPAAEVELDGDPYDVGWVAPVAAETPAPDPEPEPEPEPQPDIPAEE